MLLLLSYNHAFGDYWTACGCLSPSIVGGSKFYYMEREFSPHQPAALFAAVLYNVSVRSLINKLSSSSPIFIMRLLHGAKKLSQARGTDLI